MGALGYTQRTRGRRRVGSALEWQGGRRVSAHVQPARTFQGVSCAPGSAQHELRKVSSIATRSDLAAEEGCEEGGPDAEEGHEEVWDEVQGALSTMEHEEFDATAEADLGARSQASRPSSASSQASVRS